MSPDDVLDGGWSWDTGERTNGPTSAGWGIGDSGWGVTETSLSDGNKLDNQNKASATTEQTAIGWGGDSGWGTTEASGSNPSKSQSAERKTSVTSVRGWDPPPISPNDEPRRYIPVC